MKIHRIAFVFILTIISSTQLYADSETKPIPIVISFDIPSQPLHYALIEFGLQTNYSVIFPLNLTSGYKSIPIFGPKPIDPALRALLSKAPLTYHIDTKRRSISFKESKPLVEKPSPSSLPSLMEEIYVTGSNIRYPMAASTLTLTSVSNADIDFSSSLLLAKTLNRLSVSGGPLSSQSTTNFGLFAPGISSIDLRNLSPNRTLVLVNGRRYVGGDSERPNVVNLNSIPSELIERIEVVTGGVSAVYGSEAVAGVVNIITYSDFEGVKMTSQRGQSAHQDAKERSASLTAGSMFHQSKGHALLHMEYSKLDEVYSRDRDFSKTDAFFDDFQDYSPFTPQGAVLTDFGLVTVADDGQWNKDFVTAEDGFNRADFRLLQVPLTRKNITFETSYQLTDTLNIFTESSYTQTQSFSQIEPTIAGLFVYVDGEDLTLPANNPFIPAEITDRLSAQEGPAPESVTFLKRFSELGPRIAKQERETKRISLGLEGDTTDWSWSTVYQYGESSREQTAQGDFNTLSFQHGLTVEVNPNSPEEYRCIDAQARAQGCVPINVFGLNSISPQAASYVAIDIKDSSVIRQNLFTARINGEPGIETPAGLIAMAAGVEWRQEEMITKADNFALSGFSSSNVSPAISGKYDVREFFIEMNIPLLSYSPFAEHLDTNLAYRYSDYSTIGKSGSWQFGLDWSPHKTIQIRTMFSESIRAPNINELYDPGTETFVTFLDPCINGGVGGPGFTEDNCSSEGIPSGYSPIEDTAPSTHSGNRNLQEEKGITKTVGLTITPTDGLAISFDYFNIEVKGAIEQIIPQFKINQCYASEEFYNDHFCKGIQRDLSNSNFLLTRLDFGVENIGTIKTAGWDMEINFDTTIFDGKLHFNSLLTRTNQWEKNVNGYNDVNLEEPGFQKWKASTQLSFSTGQFAAAWATRFLGRGVVDHAFTTDIWPKNNKLPSTLYHNISFRYELNRKSKYTLNLGISNVTDKSPPYIPSPSLNQVIGSNTAAGVYDVVGRHYYMGIGVEF